MKNSKYDYIFHTAVVDREKSPYICTRTKTLQRTKFSFSSHWEWAATSRVSTISIAIYCLLLTPLPTKRSSVSIFVYFHLCSLAVFQLVWIHPDRHVTPCITINVSVKRVSLCWQTQCTMRYRACKPITIIKYIVPRNGIFNYAYAFYWYIITRSYL